MVACYPGHGNGTMPLPHIERVTVRGRQIVIVYAEDNGTSVTGEMQNRFERMTAHLRQAKEAMDDFGRKVKEIAKMGEVRVFLPLPRRRIPWTRPHVWPEFPLLPRDPKAANAKNPILEWMVQANPTRAETAQ